MKSAKHPLVTVNFTIGKKNIQVGFKNLLKIKIYAAVLLKKILLLPLYWEIRSDSKKIISDPQRCLLHHLYFKDVTESAGLELGPPDYGQGLSTRLTCERQSISNPVSLLSCSVLYNIKIFKARELKTDVALHSACPWKQLHRDC